MLAPLPEYAKKYDAVDCEPLPRVHVEQPEPLPVQTKDEPVTLPVDRIDGTLTIEAPGFTPVVENVSVLDGLEPLPNTICIFQLSPAAAEPFQYSPPMLKMGEFWFAPDVAAVTFSNEKNTDELVDSIVDV